MFPRGENSKLGPEEWVEVDQVKINRTFHEAWTTWSKTSWFETAVYIPGITSISKFFYWYYSFFKAHEK
jgi:hypothetical protein